MRNRRIQRGIPKESIKRTVGICFIACIMLIANLYVNFTTVKADSFSALTVLGNKVVDPLGNEVNLKGVTSYDPSNQAFNITQQNTYYAEMKAWGAEVVRFGLRPDHILANTNLALNRLENAITLAANNGLYSIIDLHIIGSVPKQTWPPSSYGTNYAITEQQVKDFWQQVATLYKNDNRVAFYELQNEPTDFSVDALNPTAAEWLVQRDFYHRIIDHVRQFDPDKPVMVGGLAYAYQLQFTAQYPIERSNVIYAVHPYPANELPWENYWGFLADEYPVFLSEWGFDNVHINEHAQLGEYKYNAKGGTGYYREELIEYIDSKPGVVGWTAWIFGSDWYPNMYDDANFTPSEYGEHVKALFLGIPTPPPSTPSGPFTFEHFNHGLYWSGNAAISQITPGSDGTGGAMRIDYSAMQSFTVNKNISNDWSYYTSMSIDIMTPSGNQDHPVRIIVGEAAVDGTVGELWEATVHPTSSWSTSTIPFASFTLRTDWQPSSTFINPGQLDLKNLKFFRFIPPTNKSSVDTSMVVDNIMLHNTMTIPIYDDSIELTGGYNITAGTKFTTSTETAPALVHSGTASQKVVTLQKNAYIPYGIRTDDPEGYADLAGIRQTGSMNVWLKVSEQLASGKIVLALFDGSDNKVDISQQFSASDVGNWKLINVPLSTFSDTVMIGGGPTTFDFSAVSGFKIIVNTVGSAGANFTMYVDDWHISPIN